MAKSTITYWNPLDLKNRGKWHPVNGLEGMAEELTLRIDENRGEYTRLTRSSPGADTAALGGKGRAYL
ncbi:MAG: hypothetical protein ACE5DW_02045 [Thermodesulfobacteriota bacterium]